MMAPIETVETGRDPAGRFVKGNSGGPGRPRGFDFRAVVAELAEAEQFDLDAALWRIAKRLIAAAEKGDVQAAKLVLDRLCGKDQLALNETAAR